MQFALHAAVSFCLTTDHVVFGTGGNRMFQESRVTPSIFLLTFVEQSGLYSNRLYWTYRQMIGILSVLLDTLSQSG